MNRALLLVIFAVLAMSTHDVRGTDAADAAKPEAAKNASSPKPAVAKSAKATKPAAAKSAKATKPAAANNAKNSPRLGKGNFANSDSSFTNDAVSIGAAAPKDGGTKDVDSTPKEIGRPAGTPGAR